MVPLSLSLVLSCLTRVVENREREKEIGCVIKTGINHGTIVSVESVAFGKKIFKFSLEWFVLLTRNGIAVMEFV